MSRRYKIGTHPRYDRTFDKRKLKSPVLSPQNTSDFTMPNMRDEAGLKHLLAEWTGDENAPAERAGEFYRQRDGRWHNSRLKNAEIELQRVFEKFSKLNDTRRRQGKLELDTMPGDLLEERLIAEATLDIRKEEIAELQKRLDAIQEQEQKTKNSQMLRRGPQMAIWGDPPRTVDGQQCGTDPETGLIIIDDPESPYDKMPLVAYRKLIYEPFIEAEKQRKKKLRKKIKKRQERGESAADLPSLSRTTAVPKNRLPDRPSDDEIQQFLAEHNLLPEEESEALEEA